jgi:hypothetical protein
VDTGPVRRVRPGVGAGALSLPPAGSAFWPRSLCLPCS